MVKRNCIFTGKEARCKRRFLNKSLVNDDYHNWSLEVPCNIEYDRFRGDAAPTKLEIEAFDLFWKIETLKVKSKISKEDLSSEINNLENDLKQIQHKINLIPIPKRDGPTKKDKIKEKEITTSIVAQELTEINGQNVDDFFENMKKKIWND